MEIGPFETGRVHEGDCLELMREIPAGAIDALVTDPPWPDCAVDLGWLGPDWWARVAAEMERVVGSRGKIIIHLGSQVNPAPFLSPFTLPFVHICWLEFTPPRYRGNILNHGDVAYQFGYGFLPRGHRQRVLPEVCKAPSKGKWAKNAKKALSWFTCYRNEGHVSWLIRTQIGRDRVVLDPFSGSGTTGVATIKCDSEFIGFETVPERVEKSNERLKATKMGLTLHEFRIQGQGSLFTVSRSTGSRSLVESEGLVLKKDVK